MSESLSIHHDVGGHQFETTVDGHRAYLAYMDLGKQTLDIYRTFVPDSLRGRGIAAALTEHAPAVRRPHGLQRDPVLLLRGALHRASPASGRSGCLSRCAMKTPGISPAFSFRLAQPRWRFGSTSLSLACMLRMLFSVVAQSMHASVMETPY